MLLSNDSSLPYVEISVGYALFAKYRFMLVDSEGHTIWTKTGHSADGIVEKFGIGTSLDRMGDATLSWRVVVAAFDEGEQPFFAEIRVTQNNMAVPNGVFQYQGSFTLAKSIRDGAGIDLLRRVEHHPIPV